MIRAFTFVVLVTASLQAQEPLLESWRTPLPACDVFVPDIARADFNGDGRGDLILIQRGDRPRLMLSQGIGWSHADGPAELADEWLNDVAPADFDGDGDVDAALLNGNNELLLMLNDGQGGFSMAPAAWLPPSILTANGIAGFDADGDGDEDLVAFGHSQLQMFLNDGSGRFSDVTATHCPTGLQVWGVTAFDLDADGDLDLAVGRDVLGEPFGTVAVLINDGSGHLSEDLLRVAPSLEMTTTSTAVADVDGDGDPDLIAAGDGCPDRIYQNTGGFLMPMAGTGLSSADQSGGDVIAEDLDGDGDVDLFFARGNVLWNDGSGAFLTAAPVDVQGEVRCAATLDYDGDGKSDLALSGPGFIELQMQRPGSFVSIWEPDALRPIGVEGYDEDALVIDLGVDDAFDLISPAGYLGRTVARNDGTGRFSSGTLTALPTIGLSVFDLNDDGFEDLLCTHPVDPGAVFWGDAQGNLTRATTSPIVGLPADVEGLDCVDLDGDGDSDLVLLSRAAAPSSFELGVMLQDAQGQFQFDGSGLIPASLAAYRFVIGDFDGDGDPDLIADQPYSLLFLENDGTGKLSDTTGQRFPVGETSLPLPQVLDYDGDGDLDLFVDLYPIELWRNAGAGSFAKEPLAHTDQYTRSAGVLDFDLDGDQDFWMAADELFELWLRESAGLVLHKVWAFDQYDNFEPVRWRDADGDGDLDLHAEFMGGDLLWLNRSRQTYASAVPVAGALFEVQVDFRPGWLSGNWVAATALSTARASYPPTPWGNVGIDINLAGLFGTAPLPAPEGSVTMSMAIPAWPSLIGLEIHLQSYIFPPSAPFQAVLTNVYSERIR